MSTTPYDEQLDVQPFWKVQLVFDPDGNGRDFAYTMGLFDRDLPELHMYARPSLGDDPGADWKFGTGDCGRIMNELASMLVRGALDIGSTVRREYDGGLAVVEFRVDPPGDKTELEAFGVHPDATVLPVRWSLTRPVEGPAVPLTLEAERLARQRYDELVRPLDAGLVLPRGWQLSEAPSFDTGQRFGPMTPLVLARAAQFLQADPRTLGDFVMMTHAVDEAAGVSWPMVRARGIGRGVGRAGALDALEGELTRLFDGGPHNARLRRCWKEVVDAFVADTPRESPPVRRSQVKRNVLDLLFGGMLACLSGEVVADLADQELRLWAAGPWQATSYVRPGPEWYAAEPVLDRVRRILSGLCANDLSQVGAEHYHSFTGDDCGPVESGYAALRRRLTSWAVISAACCPPPQELVTDRDVGVFLALKWAMGSAEEHDHLNGLNDWLECLTSILVHRARLSAEDVRRFARPVRGLVPGLEALLNEPV